jgi:hypothetical protein
VLLLSILLLAITNSPSTLNAAAYTGLKKSEPQIRHLFES